MQVFYEAVLDVFDEIEEELATEEEGQSYRLFYAKESVGHNINFDSFKFFLFSP